ncbi:MAG: MFS transporter [Acidimicrobiales bacterium]|nr:MFS transporter [Acidimicrobiales bacterium]
MSATTQPGASPAAPARLRPPPLWLLLAAGGLLVAISGGVRATFGLYLDPVIDDLGSDRAMYGLAIAIQSIVWGVGQPIAGAIADRFGAARVLGAGAAIYAVGLFSMAAADDALALHATAGFLAGAGMAAASLSVVLASLSRLAPADRRSQALGIATAFGTAGQVALIPLTQWILDTSDWRTAALVMGVILVAMAVAAPAFRGSAEDQTRPDERSVAPLTPLREDLRKARYSRGYLLLNTAFFVCGFHVTFIATHLKSYASDLGQSGRVAAWALVLIGLFNMVGSYSAGVLGGRYSKTRLLSLVYGARAIVIAVFVLVPAGSATTLVFGAAIGLLWLTTVPLTSGIIAAQFGTANAGALFGIVFLSHQVGAFIGAWLGGYLADSTGSYDVVWWLSVALGVMAAVIHLLLDEGPAPDPPPPGQRRVILAPATNALFVVVIGFAIVATVQLGADATAAESTGFDVTSLWCPLHPAWLS